MPLLLHPLLRGSIFVLSSSENLHVFSYTAPVDRLRCFDLGPLVTVVQEIYWYRFQFMFKVFKNLFSLLWLGLVLSSLGLAHSQIFDSLKLDLNGSEGQGVWEISLDHLLVDPFANHQNLDAKQQLALWERRRELLLSNLHSALEIKSQSQACAVKFDAPDLKLGLDGYHLFIPLGVDCGEEIRKLEIKDLFLEEGSTYKFLISIKKDGRSYHGILDRDRAFQRFDLSASPSSFLVWISQGLWHIWIGFDHLLFLLTLLLPAVLIREAGSWKPTHDFRRCLAEVLQVVTAFTLAHSLTLAVATFGLLKLPERWVESTIAFSILVAALNNFFPFFQGKRWRIAFFFGLIHGFGFASVLSDLETARSSLLFSLLGFNLGVELGQLTWVILFVPLAFIIRKSKIYNPILFKMGSGVAVILALIWLVDRLL